MSTLAQLQARGIRCGDVVVTPDHEGRTLAMVTRLFFTHVMVRYADRTVIGWPPEKLTKASEAQTAAYIHRVSFAPEERPS